MRERRTPSRPQAKVRHPSLLSLEIHAGLPSISEAARRRRVLDIGLGLRDAAATFRQASGALVESWPSALSSLHCN
jgi:hypothetical protein